MSGKKLKVNEALVKALEGATEPRKAKEIIDAALPLTALSTKTPRATIAHALSVEARKDGGLFERTGPGMYRLREQKQAEPTTEPAAATSEPEVKPDTKQRQTRGSASKRASTAKRTSTRGSRRSTATKKDTPAAA